MNSCAKYVQFSSISSVFVILASLCYVPFYVCMSILWYGNAACKLHEISRIYHSWCISTLATHFWQKNLYHTQGLKHESQFFIWFPFNSCSHVIRFQAKSACVCYANKLDYKCNAMPSKAMKISCKTIHIQMTCRVECAMMKVYQVYALRFTVLEC